MKKLSPLLLLVIVILVFGCIMEKHKSYVRRGILVTGLNRGAFLKVWGPPDRTYTITSEEFSSLRAGWGDYGGGVGYFKGKVPLNVWVYKEKETELVFYGVRLIAWKTEKSVEELKGSTRPQKPKSNTLEEYTKEKKKSP